MRLGWCARTWFDELVVCLFDDERERVVKGHDDWCGVAL
jgi:hypothetical protein